MVSGYENPFALCCDDRDAVGSATIYFEPFLTSDLDCEVMYLHHSKHSLKIDVQMKDITIPTIVVGTEMQTDGGDTV